jgi:hypothetical protein
VAALKLATVTRWIPQVLKQTHPATEQLIAIPTPNLHLNPLFLDKAVHYRLHHPMDRHWARLNLSICAPRLDLIPDHQHDDRPRLTH